MSIIPNYKNYGGLGHGGDYVENDNYNPGIDPYSSKYIWQDIQMDKNDPNYGQPISPANGQDTIYRTHDMAYGWAEIRLANGEISPTQAKVEKLWADLQLEKDLFSYNPFTDTKVTASELPEAKSYQAAAKIAFAEKMSLDIFDLAAGGAGAALLAELANILPQIQGAISAAAYGLLAKAISNGFNVLNLLCNFQQGTSFFTSAQNFIIRRDPLTLDLDGDGIETLGVSSTNPVLFDFNSDGTKTNTGWISPDDGMLVLDRNNNGTIDNASELFSDYTLLNSGNNAANGFAALKDQDTNNDGVVNNLDANWNNLKVWRDVNSDGISQANEMHTLDDLGITGLNVARTNTTQTLATGNSIKGTGTYTKADGSTGNMGDVYLKVDTTTQQFTDTVTVSPEVEALPDMSGSGLVRDLHQAASLSPTLQTILTQYSQATTRNEQMAIIDKMLYAWADTSGMAATMDTRDEELRRAA